MKKALLAFTGIFVAAHMASAMEVVSSSSYSDVTCSMEDYTCEKMIVEQGREEALARLTSGDKSAPSPVLKEAIAIVKAKNNLQQVSDEYVEMLLITNELSK